MAEPCTFRSGHGLSWYGDCIYDTIRLFIDKIELRTIYKLQNRDSDWSVEHMRSAPDMLGITDWSARP
jgi:hypothetical protein